MKYMDYDPEEDNEEELEYKLREVADFLKEKGLDSNTIDKCIVDVYDNCLYTDDVKILKNKALECLEIYI